MNILRLSARSLQKMLAATAVFALVFSPFANLVPVAEAAASASLKQAENGPLSTPENPVKWVNGNVGPSKGHYSEGDSIPYRIIAEGLTPGVPSTLIIGFDVTKSSKFAIDYITSNDRINEIVNPCSDIPTICSGAPVTADIPAPAYTGSINGYGGTEVAGSFAALEAAEGNQVMKVWNGNITSIVYSVQANLNQADAKAEVSITFTPTSNKAVFSWGGHISSSLDYPGESAINISGSPYHTNIVSIDGKGGKEDAALSASAVAYPGNLIVIKKVVGGPKTANQFTINVIASSSVTPAQFSASEDGTLVTIDVPNNGQSTYSVTEVTDPDYQVAYSDDCSGTVAALQQKVCTITNTYVEPVANLTLTKIVSGGSANENQWTVTATGPETISGAGTVTDTVTPGVYTLSETGSVARYQAGVWQCTGGSLVGDQLTLANGDSANCTITNTYVPPLKASITVIKNIINDNGGTAIASTFKYFVDALEVLSGATNLFDAGTYTVTETGAAANGYAAGTWSGTNCTNGTVVVGEGESATCEITNDDIAPSIKIKKVVNNGTSETPMDPEDFDIVLTATDINGTTDDEKTFAGSLAGETFTFDAGSYSVTEPNHPGFSMVLSGDCSGTALLNTTRECTVTNTYIEPTVSTVTFVKEVTNNNGGTANPEDFSFTVNGQTVKTGESVQLPIGTYAVVENGPTSGYAASYSVACQGGSITIESFHLGKQRTCTVTNDDIAPELTIIKKVENDNKYNVGTAVASDFTLLVDATNASEDTIVGDEAGVTITLDAGDYAVTEEDAGDYNDSYSEECDGTIAVGEKKVCTVTNNDIAPNEAVLIVKKTLNKLFGGLETVVDFAFSINDGDSIPFEEDGENRIVLTTEGEYDVDEIFASRYDVSYDGCEFNAEFGASYTCEITNDELPECSDGVDNDQDGFTDWNESEELSDPSCTDGDDDTEAEKGAIYIEKVVTGEGASPTQAFTFAPAWEAGNVVVSQESAATGWTELAPGTYTISETDIPSRYDLESVVCVDSEGGSEGQVELSDNEVTVSLSVDEQVTCTFTNDHTPRDSDGNTESITVTKEVTVGSDSRELFAFSFPWRTEVMSLGANMSEASGDLAADEIYTISELGIPLGWSLYDFTCTSDDYEEVEYAKISESQNNGVSIYLRDGENVECTFTNDQERFILEGYVWEDEDEDGVYDEDESPLQGWVVRATDGEDNLTTESNSEGYYSFNVPRGTWTISETVKSGWDQTFPFASDEFVHVVTVPTVGSEEEYIEESYLSALQSFFISTAHAGLVGTYGPYNFGNDRDTSGGGGRRNNDNDDEPTPTPQVLGEQVSVVPIGAADAGAGSTSPIAIPSFGIAAAAFIGRARK